MFFSKLGKNLPNKKIILQLIESLENHEIGKLT
jgi:hypothetical protein